jgi:hypothetical protein
LKLIFAGYTGSKNPVQNMLIKNPVCQTWFFQMDSSEIKYRTTRGMWCVPTKATEHKKY